MKSLGKNILYGVVFIAFFVILCKAEIMPFDFLTVPDNAMKPVMSKGDLALVFMPRTLHVEEGDIILFHLSGESRLRRVVKMNSGGAYVIQGDANDTTDDNLVTEPLGTYVLSIPRLGEWIEDAKNTALNLPEILTNLLDEWLNIF